MMAHAAKKTVAPVGPETTTTAPIASVTPKKRIGKSTASPVARPSPADVAAAVAPHAAGLATMPSQVVQPVAATPVTTAKPEPTVQVNFKCSTTMEGLIFRLSEQAGGVRVMFAQLLKQAGHDVPSQDLEVKAFGKRRVR